METFLVKHLKASKINCTRSSELTFIQESHNKIKLWKYVWNKNVVAISNKKTTNELLLIKYVKNTKLFLIESHEVYTEFKVAVLNYSENR